MVNQSAATEHGGAHCLGVDTHNTSPTSGDTFDTKGWSEVLVVTCIDSITTGDLTIRIQSSADGSSSWVSHYDGVIDVGATVPRSEFVVVRVQDITHRYMRAQFRQSSGAWVGGAAYIGINAIGSRPTNAQDWLLDSASA